MVDHDTPKSITGPVVPSAPGASATPLRRSLNLPILVLYGLGTTVGAGIYALIGEIAGIANYMSPWSFLLASVLAGSTAVSFAELSSRFPKAAGAALYVQHGFSSVRLATLTGGLVVLAGIVSSAALVVGFVGYASEILTLNRQLLIGATVMTLAVITVWGISQSVLVAGIITLIEVGGLIWIIVLGVGTLSNTTVQFSQLLPDFSVGTWVGISSGSLLAFYAFIGFEDMVEVAEEVKDVQRTLPIAIMVALLLTTLIYILLMVTAVLVMSPQVLGQSEAPMSALFQHLTHGEPTVMTFIGMLAIINGALIQIIMASRVLYGLASRGQLPGLLARVNVRTQTPVLATLLIVAAVLALALTGGITQLAGVTSLLMLVVFAMVNLALWRFKGATEKPDIITHAQVFAPQVADPDGLPLYPAFRFPRWISLFGFIVCTFLLLLTLVHTVQNL